MGGNDDHVSVDTWQDALTRRLRTLLRTAPLHRLELGKGRRPETFTDQDLRALALRVLDVVIEEMGLGVGATHDDLREALRPMVASFSTDLSADEVDEVATVVIEGLLNEGERRQAFCEGYAAVTAEGVERRMLSFHLLRERETPEGSTAIFATTEGINLYAGMLEYPVEDAQIAEEAVLQAQVHRGRIADAVQTARRARLRSIEYEQKMVSILETTRRDISQVAWVEEVLGLIDRARQHVEERIAIERDILRAVEARLDVVEDARSGEQLAGLKGSLQECVVRHTRLHERLIGANRFYLDEQERQAFRPRPATPLPDLEAEALRPALALPAGVLDALVDPLLVSFSAPRPPAMIRVVTLVDRLLAPRREEHETPFELLDPDLELLASDPRRFSPEDHQAVETLLATASTPTTLGELLRGGRARAISVAAQRLLVLRLLIAFDAGELEAEGAAGSLERTSDASRRDATLRVERADAMLDVPGFYGDDLAVFRSRHDA